MSARPIDEVAPGVFVTTSERYVTTSTMIKRGDRIVLVDPAWSPGELQTIVDWLAKGGLTVTAGFHTHAHHDHLLWHPAFGDAPRWLSARSAQLAVEWRAELLDSIGDEFPAEWPNPLDGLRSLSSECLPDPFRDDTDSGDSDSDDSIVLVTHDGHAPGHTAVWLPDRRTLLAGDMLSDVELPLPFAPDDLRSYLEALDRLAPFVATAEVLIPGHGHPTEQALARLDADRMYLDAVLGGREANDPRRALSGMEQAHQRIVELARQLADDEPRI